MIALRDRPRAVGPGVHDAVHLGGEHDFVSPPEIAHGPPDDLLARSARVDIGRIEEVDPRVDGTLDVWPALVLAQGPPMISAVWFAVAHAAQTDAGDLKAGPAQGHVLHVHLRITHVPICGGHDDLVTVRHAAA